MSDPGDNASSGDDGEILRLDPNQRLKLRRIGAGIVIAAVLIIAFFYYGITHGNALEVMQRMNLMCYLLSLGLFATAGYLGWYARRIHRAALYPPPDGWLLGDTRVLRGDAARIQARWVGICAIVFAALAIYAAYLPHSIAKAIPPLQYQQLVQPADPSHG